MENSKQIELLKKLKALADKGVGGEATNAKTLLDKMLEKHGMSIEDLEREELQDYYFSVEGIDKKILAQCAKRVSYDIKIYDIPVKIAKKHKLAGNVFVTCNVAQFIEIEQMFAVYSKLYKEEVKIFFSAFLAANDLLINTPEPKSFEDLTEQEKIDWRRAQAMAEKIRTETIRRQLKTQN